MSKVQAACGTARRRADPSQRHKFVTSVLLAESGTDLFTTHRHCWRRNVRDKQLNAFTEDLFHWDNDLDGDRERYLQLNSESRFFAGLKELEMDNRIRRFLQRYTDFDFVIDYDKWLVRFSREVNGAAIDNIKVSRGEENLFIWCFFLAIAQLALDGADAYKWVKYIYVDDPVSSLDENNAIAVGHDLAQLLARKDHAIKAVFSSHHSLFFNVLWNELREIDRKKFAPHFLSCSQKTGQFHLIYTGDTPFFHRIATFYKRTNEGCLDSDQLNLPRFDSWHASPD